MDRVVAEEIDEVVKVHEGVINCHDLSILGILGEGGAENETANSAESIDTHFDVRHPNFLLTSK